MKKKKMKHTQMTDGTNRWVHNAGSEMLIKEVLSPLLDIIFLYKESSFYNYVPGTNEDCDAGWAYFLKYYLFINTLYAYIKDTYYLTISLTHFQNV